MSSAEPEVKPPLVETEAAVALPETVTEVEETAPVTRRPATVAALAVKELALTELGVPRVLVDKAEAVMLPALLMVLVVGEEVETPAALKSPEREREKELTRIQWGQSQR